MESKRNVFLDTENAKMDEDLFQSRYHHLSRVSPKVLDVAGLVPGASEGKGLGNKFLGVGLC